MHEEFSCIGRCLFGDYCPRRGGLSGGLRGMLGAADVGGARSGGLPALLPAHLAVPESVGVACLLCRRLTLPFVFFLAPIPPAPFPSGEGGDQGYFMQGASPLASPRLSRRRHGLNLRCRCPLGGLPGWSPADLAVPESVGVACPLCRRLTLPLVYFYAPYPHPLPLRGRGRPKVYFAGGFAPGTPALDRSRHLQSFPNRHPAEWRLFATRVPAAPAGANAPFEAERTGFPQAMPVPRPIQPPGMQGAKPLA